MNSYTKIEITVGAFVIAGVLALGYLSISVGGLDLLPGGRYPLNARFATVGDLKKNAQVKLAGVPVGKVSDIQVEDYVGVVRFEVQEGLELPADTIASIRTAGLLGEAYISLSPGAAEENLEPGDRIAQTEPPLDLMQLLGKYAFGSVEDGDDTGQDQEESSPFPDPLETP